MPADDAAAAADRTHAHGCTRTHVYGRAFMRPRAHALRTKLPATTLPAKSIKSSTATPPNPVVHGTKDRPCTTPARFWGGGARGQDCGGGKKRREREREKKYGGKTLRVYVYTEKPFILQHRTAALGQAAWRSRH